MKLTVIILHLLASNQTSLVPDSAAKLAGKRLMHSSINDADCSNCNQSLLKVANWMLFFRSCFNNSPRETFAPNGFQPSRASFSTFLNNCGRDENLGTTTCLKTVDGVSMGMLLPVSYFLSNKDYLCVHHISS